MLCLIGLHKNCIANKRLTINLANTCKARRQIHSREIKVRFKGATFDYLRLIYNMVISNSSTLAAGKGENVGMWW